MTLLILIAISVTLWCLFDLVLHNGDQKRILKAHYLHLEQLINERNHIVTMDLTADDRMLMNITNQTETEYREELIKGINKQIAEQSREIKMLLE